MKERNFEDYQVGEVLTYGDTLVTEHEIIEFASRYDPQSFHIDPEAARGSLFGGLIASGWQTGSIYMGLMVRGEMLIRRQLYIMRKRNSNYLFLLFEIA